VQWFNDCVQVFVSLPQRPPVSFVNLLSAAPVVQAEAA
jgi:hypothetical protein